MSIGYGVTYEQGLWRRRGPTIVLDLPPAWSQETTDRAAPAWPPKRGPDVAMVRHWYAAGDLLDASQVAPGFAAPATTSCLDPWRISKTASAKIARVAMVDLSGGGAAYDGIRDGERVYLASVAKLGIMYPVFQLRNDLSVIASRVGATTSKDLYDAARTQWADDLVTARRLSTRKKARAWIDANGPKLEQCAGLDASRNVVFDPGLESAVTSMVELSSAVGRATCVARLKAFYIRSVLAQSGTLNDLDPLDSWIGSMRAVVTLVTLVSQRKLVSDHASIAMLALMAAGARGSVGTWGRFAFDGLDDPSDASKRRSYASIAGKIGYLYSSDSPRSPWYHHITRMADVSLVGKAGGKLFVLAYAIPGWKSLNAIPLGDVLPLIRATYDCI